jgi:two-component system chemotaxis sensor kinase CheA
MFNALERAARDAATTLGKSVAFETRGGDVRIGADVLSAMQSALVHVVRNAVAHGVEPPSERRAAGKAADGRISLEVVRRGSRVAFTCRDDGRGIDMAQVARAARRAGKVSEAHAPSDGDLLRLLLSGGVSTSAGVTDVSGRGVGLDVVRETASRLGGEVILRTDAGRGTALEVVVPVSLSSVEALLVESGGTIAALPLDAVRGTLRLGPGDVTRTADGESVRWEGRLVPFAPLARSLDLEASHREARGWSAVVLEGAGVFAAIGVDRLVGTESVILRALPKEVLARPVISGASLDARGLPQPFLDAAALAANVRAAQLSAPVASPTQRVVLVVDDSLTTRMLEKSILESAGYEVDLATSGEEGLAKAKRRRYALFLVDVEMPGMDGFAFVQRTREDAELRGVPAILVTSRAAPEDRQRGEAAGASGYIVKSEFDQNDLLRRIGKLVG